LVNQIITVLGPWLRIGRCDLWIGIGERFPGIRFNERLLVDDELVQDLVGNFTCSCLNAIAYPPCAGVVIAIMESRG
jgi:hypothetical protein